MFGAAVPYGTIVTTTFDGLTTVANVVTVTPQWMGDSGQFVLFEFFVRGLGAIRLEFFIAQRVVSDDSSSLYGICQETVKIGSD
jgi:hypothetical protein